MTTAKGGARRGDDDPRRLLAERDALLKLCEAQRRKLERQAAELARLRARLGQMTDEQGQ